MSSEIIGYCLKCKAKRRISKPFIYRFKTSHRVTKDREGMRAIKGFCEVCGTKMFKILPKNETRVLIEDF